VDAFTYRCQEDQCLLEIAKVLDLFVANTAWNILDEGVKLFKCLLAKDRLDDVLVNLLGGVLAQTTLFAGR